MIRNFIIAAVIKWIASVLHLPEHIGTADNIKAPYNYPAPAEHPITPEAPYRPDVSVGPGSGASI